MNVNNQGFTYSVDFCIPATCPDSFATTWNPTKDLSLRFLVEKILEFQQQILALILP